jgi:protocatechuate 3,4-dioxygenase beta subunit
MVVILRLTLGVLLATQVVALAQQAPVTIHGRVVAADTDAALPRARVTFLVNRDSRPPVYTDERGEFSIALPSAGSVTLSVVKAGFAVVQIPVQTESLDAARGLSIALTRSAAVNGRVVDTNGETLVGARVYADRVAGEANSTSDVVKFFATTDDRGDYRLGGLPPGRYSVTATGAQEPGAVVTLDLRPGDELSGIGFTVVPPQESAMVSSPQPRETAERATIRGQVVTTAGRPIAQAVVNITGPMSPRYFVTDRQGRFAFPGLVAGDYEVAASKSDFLPGAIDQQTAFESSSRIAVTAGARVNNVSLVLSRGLAVTGTIVDRAGEPLQGVSVHALQLTGSGERRRAVFTGAQIGGLRQTDDRGRYRLLGLQPGTYIIVGMADSASLGGTAGSQTVPFYFPGSASIADATPVTITSGDIDGIDFAVADVPTARVSGVALDSAGAPLRGTIRLSVSQRSGSIVPAPRTMQPGTDGAFSFLNVAPGDYVVQASGSPDPRDFRPNVPFDPRDAFEFAAQYVTVGAQDPDPVNLRAARGAVVEASIVIDSADRSESFDRMRIDTHSIGSDLTSAAFSMQASGVPFGGGNRRVRLTSLFGPWRFVVSGMPEGWYLKSLTINGMDMTDQVIDLGAGGGTASAEVVVSPKGGTIAGRIRHEGLATRAGSVVVFPQDREKWFERSRFIKMVRASQDGSFRAGSLPPGDYYVASIATVPETVTPEMLESLLSRAVSVMVNEGEARKVELSR